MSAKSSALTKKQTFVVCRVLWTRRDRKDYVVFPNSEVSRRHDVRRVSKGFASEADANAEIERLGGTIPTGYAMFLDDWEEDGKTVWNWKDNRTLGASQVFDSKQEALGAWHNDILVFDLPPD